MNFLKFQFDILFTKKVLRFKKINTINREIYIIYLFMIYLFFFTFTYDFKIKNRHIFIDLMDFFWKLLLQFAHLEYLSFS